ncbi:MAG: NIPSNAP family protein [Pirellulaceae bacterium]
MMKRRDFLAASSALGLLPMAAMAADDASSDRSYLELRIYHMDNQQQRDGFESFAQEAAIPALNRLGIAPVGVFYPAEALSPVYVLLPHKSPASVGTLVARLGQDQEFLSRGAAFLEAPAYKRMESSLMIAFQGMPHVETPIASGERIFQLRIYESPSEMTGQKKIEMFNEAGEIAIFRRVGLHPVFFGETLVGSNMPNLTYMLSFESAQQMQENWQKFGKDPDWQRLKGMEEYADKRILSNITNLVLKPAPCSQI